MFGFLKIPISSSLFSLTNMMPYIIGFLLHLCFLNSVLLQTISDSHKLNDSSLDPDVSLNRIKKDAPIPQAPIEPPLLISHPSLAHLLPEEDSAFIQAQQTLHLPNDLKTNTFPFIEAIVRRTVNKYMNVIRTQSNWLELLLQLVREEREIRSRYNCFTDACIYKIQLFTSQLKLGNPTAASSAADNLSLTGRRLKRPRRSVDLEPPPSLPPQATKLEYDNFESSEPDLSRLQPTIGGSVQVASESTPTSLNDIVQNESSPITLGEPEKLANEYLVHEDDDALRLLDDSESKRLNPHGSELQPDESASTNQSRLKATQIDNHSKIGVARFSQEQNKFLSQQIPEIMKLKQNEDLQELAIPMTPPTHLVNEAATEGETTTMTMTGISSESHLETDLGTNFNSPSADVEISKVDSDTDGVLVGESDLALDKEPELTVHKDDGPDIMSDSQPVKPAIEIDPLVPVIPFGLNKFEGESYENCSGRYENYCYNAIKCVYISVLETAACYCRTGYTGVRCDMYNLPQTLDIFKSFGERIVDFSSMQKLNVYTVYSVVEATARYTVNAVLEEKLLAAWEDEGPF